MDPRGRIAVPACAKNLTLGRSRAVVAFERPEDPIVARVHPGFVFDQKTRRNECAVARHARDRVSANDVMPAEQDQIDFKSGGDQPSQSGPRMDRPDPGTTELCMDSFTVFTGAALPLFQCCRGSPGGHCDESSRCNGDRG